MKLAEVNPDHISNVKMHILPTEKVSKKRTVK